MILPDPFPAADGRAGLPGSAPQVTGMAAALLAEIAGHVQALLADGTETEIDVRSLPMAPSDLDALQSALGTGEVSAEITGHGRSTVTETAFPGVWWISHYDTHDAFLMHQIAIARVPDILRTDPDDIEQGLARLGALSRAQDLKETPDA
jgi:hydrogenase-1 operon protein HyaF